MPDALDIVWASFDTPHPLFTPEAESAWPVGTSYDLATMKLLISTDNASQVVCPACSQRHVEEVIVRPGADGIVRNFIYCPEALRVEVPNAIVWQRTWNYMAIAEALTSGLALSGSCRELIPDRLWRLGKLPQDTSREILLARGLAWRDGQDIARHIGGQAIVLVAQHPLPQELWKGGVPALIPLARVAQLESRRIVLDVTHMWSIVHETDQAAEASQVLPLDQEHKNMVVRRQLKAELKSFLSDDALVAAYRLHGSYRKAAEALSAETGTPISKDKVQRAVQRHGGVPEVIQDGDSDSVKRTVASQRRDRTRKILTQAK